MKKIFFNNRCIELIPNYNDCFKTKNAVVFLPQSLNDITYIVKQFLTNHKLAKLHIGTENLDFDNVFNQLCSTLKLITAGGGLVQNGKDEVLMIFRFNHWDLPKGWQEDGETVEQTALREVKEECGLQGLELGDFITTTYHIYQQNNSYILKETHWFKLFYEGNIAPKPQIEESIESVRWISKEQLPLYLNKAYPSIKEVFIAADFSIVNEL